MIIVAAAILVLSTVVFGVITTFWEFKELMEHGTNQQGAYKKEDRIQLIEPCRDTGKLKPGRFGNIIKSVKELEYVVKYSVQLDEVDSAGKPLVKQVIGTQNMAPVTSEYLMRSRGESRDGRDTIVFGDTSGNLNRAKKLSDVEEIEGESASSSEEEILMVEVRASLRQGEPSRQPSSIELQARYTHAVNLETGMSATDGGCRAGEGADSRRSIMPDTFPDFETSRSSLKPHHTSNLSRHSLAVALPSDDVMMEQGSLGSSSQLTET